MSPPFDVELELNRHGAALRTLAGELIADRHSAEDAVQQVWLDALQRPPRHGGAVGGGLAMALRNVIGGWRRSDRRRARREGEVVAARGDAADDHAVTLAREELAERLLAAVRSLEPAHRDAIWQRYFQGKAPRDIAAAAGVPVETVKTRQKRALAALRERLGEREGREWRAGFAAAFGFGRNETTAATAVIAGGLVMATWTKVGAAVVALAVIAAVVWWPDAPAITPVAVGDAPAPVAIAAEAGAQQPAAPSVRTERTAAAGSASDPKLAVVRGRCIDANGAPIAGCAVKLFGWNNGGSRDEDWILEHGKTDVEHTASTSADGRFEFAIEPPPPFQFALDVQGDVWANGGFRWDHIDAGALLDVGDLAMQPGVALRGRVVDADGRAVAEVSVAVSASSHARLRGLTPRTWANGRTASDGTFALDTTLGHGTYALRVSDDYVVQSPAPLVIGADTAREMRIVVTRPDVPTITGVVVDEREQPVRHPRLEWATTDANAVHAYGRQDGSFVLRCTAGDSTQPVKLAVRAPGYEPMQCADGIAWGTRDVRVRLLRGTPDLTLTVRDPAGRPLEGCTLRLLRAAESQPGRAIARGRSDANGVAVFASLERGEYVVAAQFAAARGLPATLERVAIDGTPANVELRVGAQPSRRLRVQRRDGKPVAGTRVQLCEMLGNSFGKVHQVLAPRSWFVTNWTAPPILALVDAATDADGTLLLSGPGDRDLGLRVLGPGHVAVERTDVRFDTTADLVVTVATGARVHGRIAPPAAVDALHRLAGVAASEAFPADLRPFLQLRGDRGSVPPNSWVAADRGRFEIGDDGSFDVAGLPEGRWQIALRYEVKTASMTMSQDAVLGTRVLAEGESVELAPDLSELLTGTLRGVVLRNGEPWAERPFSVVATRLGADGKEQQQWMMVETDANGRFELENRPGRFELRGPDDAVATPKVDIVRGEVVSATFELTLGELTVRLLTPAGGPAAGVELLGGTTDAEGRVSVTLQPRTMALRVLPRSLASREGRARVGRRTGGGDPFAGQWIELGQATVVAGKTTTLELHLPPEWEK